MKRQRNNQNERISWLTVVITGLFLGLFAGALGVVIPPLSEPARLLLCNKRDEIFTPGTCKRWSGGGDCRVYCSTPSSTSLTGLPGYATEMRFPRSNHTNITFRYFGVMLLIYGVPTLIMTAISKLRADRGEAMRRRGIITGHEP